MLQGLAGCKVFASPSKLTYHFRESVPRLPFVLSLRHLPLPPSSCTVLQGVMCCGGPAPWSRCP